METTAPGLLRALRAPQPPAAGLEMVICWRRPEQGAASLGPPQRRPGHRLPHEQKSRNGSSSHGVATVATSSATHAPQEDRVGAHQWVSQAPSASWRAESRPPQLGLSILDAGARADALAPRDSRVTCPSRCSGGSAEDSANDREARICLPHVQLNPVPQVGPL